MKKFFKLLVCLFTAASIIFLFVPAENSYASTAIDTSTYTDGSKYENETVDVNTIKVGLKYSDSADDNFTFTNTSGNGFNFGYYDDNRKFVNLGYTSATSIKILTDYNYSENSLKHGCYHIKLNRTYRNYSDAVITSQKLNESFPAYYHGRYYVLVGNYRSLEEAETARVANGFDGEAFTAGKDCVTVINEETGYDLFEFDTNGLKTFAIEPMSKDVKSTTAFNGYEYYGGFSFPEKDRKFNVINYVGLEYYVKGVIPYEMNPEWPVEALKAQALCARTYAVANLNGYSSLGFDVKDDTSSQVYYGATGATEVSDKAVNETAGLFIWYEGKLCTTYYFSSDGGSTEDGKTIFDVNYQYLQGKSDPFEAAISFPNKSWTKTYTAEQLTNLLNDKGYNLETVKSVEGKYTENGNCVGMTVTDKNGKQIYVANPYKVLGLNSYHYTISSTQVPVEVKREIEKVEEEKIDENISNADITNSKSKENEEPEYEIVTVNVDGFAFTGGGWGHNVGMSQYGAYSMAKIYGYTYEDIIRFYFTGVYIA